MNGKDPILGTTLFDLIQSKIIVQACYSLIFTIKVVNIRDNYIISGLVTDKGRICFYSEPKRVPFYAYKRIFEDDQIELTEYDNYEEYR